MQEKVYSQLLDGKWKARIYNHVGYGDSQEQAEANALLEFLREDPDSFWSWVEQLPIGEGGASPL